MTVSAATVRSRIDFWNANPPPHGYSQSTYSRGPDGNVYRNDCSGYVSMLLGLAGSPNTGMLVGAAFTTPISKGELRFGDLIIAVAGGGHSSGHVVMFNRWANAAKTAYYGDDFGYGAAPHHTTHTYPYEADGRTFRPYRPRVLAAGAESSPAAAAGTHVVIKGETLSEIAAAYRVPGGYRALAEFNGIADPDVISVGQKIRIPAGAAAKPAAAFTPPPNGGKWILPAGHFYGDIRGPERSHGGFYRSERDEVEWIQTRLNELGAGAIAVDGRFGPATISAASKWQRSYYAAHGLRLQYPGQIWSDDWDYLIHDR